MSQKSVPSQTAQQNVREIRRRTRKQYSLEDKVRSVLSGLRGEHSIAELYRREGIAESICYAWSKDFLQAGKSGFRAIPSVRRREGGEGGGKPAN